MFGVYFDDSGTDRDSPNAIAACYISTERGWQEFNQQWDNARHGYGFDTFHMVDFAACHDKTKKPFCDWSFEKRRLVYERLATIINENKRIGIAFAIPAQLFDTVVPALPKWMQARVGKYRYTYAVRLCMGEIYKWRKACGIKAPMQYIFDRMENNPEARQEIKILWEDIESHPMWAEWYGIEKSDGYSFQSKSEFKPLQAADILAWQMNNHMRNVIQAGKNELIDTHRNFRILREDQVMYLGFLNEDQFRSSIENEMKYRIEHGQTEDRL